MASARALWAAVDRPNALIKIPATKEGLPAITAAIAEGISVNVTLIFGLERYREVMDAYLTGLEQARDAGLDLSAIQSVASFFVSRVDTEIDKRLDAIGTDEATALKGKAAVANARLAYAAFEEVVSSDRWEALADAGANRQRPLWASTGVKNPDYPDTLYVTELVVADTVNTMPEKTMEAFADHGEVTGDTGDRPRPPRRRQVFDRLAAVGIDFDDVLQVLEHEGVDKFKKSWAELVETVRGQMEKARQGRAHEQTRAGTPSTARAGGVRAVLRLPRRGGVRRGRRGAGRRPGRQRHRRPGRHAVGPGRRGRGRQAARLGGPARDRRDRWSPRSRRCEVELRQRGVDPGRAVRHGRLLARARGDLRRRRRRARRPGLLRPRLRAHRARGPARRAPRRGVLEVRRHGRDRQPAPGLREGVHRRRHRPGRADHRGHRPRARRWRSRPREAGYRVFLADPERRRPLLRADRLRAGAQRAGRRRHRRRCSTRPQAIRPGARGRLGRQPRRCASARCSARPTWPASTSWCWPTPARRTPGSATGPSSSIAESTGKDGKGILPVVVAALDCPELLPEHARRGAGHVRPRLVLRPDRRRPSGWGVHVDAPLGAQLLLWEYATAVAGRVIGINPFDQPDVESAKQAAREMLDGGGSDARRRCSSTAPVDGLRLRRLAAATGTHGRRRRRRAARRARRRARLPRRAGLPRPAPRRRSSPASATRSPRAPAGRSRSAGARGSCTPPGSTTRAAPRPASTCRSPAQPRGRPRGARPAVHLPASSSPPRPSATARCWPTRAAPCCACTSASPGDLDRRTRGAVA